MDIDIYLASTCRVGTDLFFLMDESSPIKKELGDVCYQEANRLFEKVFGYYPYPYVTINQVEFIDDLTPNPFVLYYASVDKKEVLHTGHWWTFEELTKNETAFLIYSKCLTKGF